MILEPLALDRREEAEVDEVGRDRHLRMWAVSAGFLRWKPLTPDALALGSPTRARPAYRRSTVQAQRRGSHLRKRRGISGLNSRMTHAGIMGRTLDPYTPAALLVVAGFAGDNVAAAHIRSRGSGWCQ